MRIRNDIKTVLWCGPAAVAAVTDRPVSEVMALARHFTGKRSPKGMHPGTLKAVLNALGYTTTEVFSAGLEFCAGNPQWNPTLAKWTRENAAVFRAAPCIALVSNHYVTVQGRSLIDNHTKEMTPLKRAPWRRARVARVFQVNRVAGPVFVPPPPYVAPKPKTEGRAAVLRLARKHGVEVDDRQNDMDQIWVYPPPSLTDEALDPHAGDHCAFDWLDAMQRVQDYVKALAKL